MLSPRHIMSGETLKFQIDTTRGRASHGGHECERDEKRTVYLKSQLGSVNDVESESALHSGLPWGLGSP